MSDVHESKEALLALVALGKCVASLASDGLDLSDLGALVSKFVADEKFRGLLEAGVAGISAIPEELKDIDGAEAIELVAALVDALRK